MKLILLTQGKYAQVDDKDYEYLMQWKWHYNTTSLSGYAMRSTGNKKGRPLMHRIILGITDSSIKIDHADGDGLNNQRYNLRIATLSQNAANRKKVSNKTVSKHKGVALLVDNRIGRNNKQTWYAHCCKDGIRYIRYCKTEEEAAVSYNVMALGLFGEFAKLNEI